LTRTISGCDTMNNYLDWDALLNQLGHLYKLSDIFTVEGLETCLQQLVRCAAIYTFSLVFSCFQVRNWAGSHSVGNFL